MKTQIKPLSTFRVHPDARSLYFVVRVFASKRAMHAYCRGGQCPAGRAVRATGNWRGIVHSGMSVRVYPDGREKVSQQVGEIHLYRGGLTMAVITHESSHAGLAWFRRKFRGVVAVEDMPLEEALCYSIDLIATTIVDRVERWIPRQ